MFIFKLINFILGWLRISCEACFAEAAVNLMMKHDIDYWDMHRLQDGRLIFNLTKREFRRLKYIAGDNACRFTAEFEKGLPLLFYRYRRRIGIPVGAVIFSVVLWSSTTFIWDINIKGNETVNDSEIIATLEELGCSVGTFIPSIDFYTLCNEFILKSDNISWISVNMKGTVAQVEVIELVRKGEAEDNDNGTPSNLIASRDGYIVRTAVSDGMAVVKAGDVVTKGQLLVSGVVEIGRNEEKSFKLVRSKGNIYAETYHNIEVTVPLLTEVKVYTGTTEVSKSLKFFGKIIKLQENSGILTDTCDIIKNTERIILFEGNDIIGSIPLPVYIVTDSMNEYKTEQVLLSEDEALSVAKQKLAEETEAQLSEAEILSRKVIYVTRENAEGEDELYLQCELSCLEDIAEEVLIGLK